MKQDGLHLENSDRSSLLISVIIPVYNREDLISQAIDSVLDQEHTNLELIVVDDGSTDSTPEILKSYGTHITVLTQPNSGPSAARNLGIKHARGSIIGFLDSDDMWPKGRLSSLLPYVLEGNVIVRGLTQYIKNEKVSNYHLVLINVGACLYDASVFSKVGPFDEDMKYAEDLDWEIRARELGYTELHVPVEALQHRKHEGNLTNSYANVHQGKVRAFEKKVLRAQERLQ